MPPTTPDRLTLRRWVPYAVLAIGIALTAVGGLYIERTSRLRDELAFETATDETAHLIELRLNSYLELLRAGAALFSASENVSPMEFEAFTTMLRLRERYPGIQGIGYTVWLTRADLRSPPRLLADPRSLGVAIWPAGDRDAYAPVTYLEPQDERNRRAIGFDMMSEPVRRAALERARDTGEPAASGLVRLVTDGDDRQSGFIVYMPVYRHRAAIDTRGERRMALVGFIYSPFRAQDLLSGIASSRTPLGYRVYDGAASPENLLHEAMIPARSTPHEPLRRRIETDIAGRPWTLEFEAYRHFAGSSPWLAPLAALGGALLSLALFLVMRAQIQAWAAANRLAVELQSSEEALRESSERLRRLVVLEREARADAQEADRAKDDFLATLSHELRTPLNAMLGWISMLRGGKVREERRADALEVIERNARMQARLIEDLIDVSRIVAGKIRLDTHPVAVGALVAAAVDAQRPAADQKHLRLHVDIAPDLPELRCDPNRVQQIVANLVSNAIKFTPSGGEVFVTTSLGDGEVVLTVRDTGIGIAPEFLPHVFERFRQADSSTTRAHSGIGVGLAIVRHLVELHGGTIEASSDGHDRGALFVARFPIDPHAS